MIVFDFILSGIASILILLISVFFLIIDCWLLLIPIKKRQKVAQNVLITPWCFIVSRLVFFIRLKVYGKEFCDKNRTTLYICNHQSWADILTFTAITPAAGLSKWQVRHIPMIGILSMMAGAIFFEREDTKSRLGVVKKIMKSFKDELSISYFPEGTRSRDGRLLRANLNLIKLAYKMHIPVVPATIEGSKDVIMRGRKYFRFFRKVVIKYSEPMLAENFANEDDFAQACWQKVVDSHNEILQNDFKKK